MGRLASCLQHMPVFHAISSMAGDEDGAAAVVGGVVAAVDVVDVGVDRGAGFGGGS